MRKVDIRNRAYVIKKPRMGRDYYVPLWVPAGTSIIIHAWNPKTDTHVLLTPEECAFTPFVDQNKTPGGVLRVLHPNVEQFDSIYCVRILRPIQPVSFTNFFDPDKIISSLESAGALADVFEAAYNSATRPISCYGVGGATIPPIITSTNNPPPSAGIGKAGVVYASRKNNPPGLIAIPGSVFTHPVTLSLAEIDYGPPYALSVSTGRPPTGVPSFDAGVLGYRTTANKVYLYGANNRGRLGSGDYLHGATNNYLYEVPGTFNSMTLGPSITGLIRTDNTILLSGVNYPLVSGNPGLLNINADATSSFKTYTLPSGAGAPVRLAIYEGQVYAITDTNRVYAITGTSLHTTGLTGVTNTFTRFNLANNNGSFASTYIDVSPYHVIGTDRFLYELRYDVTWTWHRLTAHGGLWDRILFSMSFNPGGVYLTRTDGTLWLRLVTGMTIYPEYGLPCAYRPPDDFYQVGTLSGWNSVRIFGFGDIGSLFVGRCGNQVLTSGSGFANARTIGSSCAADLVSLPSGNVLVASGAKLNVPGISGYRSTVFDRSNSFYDPNIYDPTVFIIMAQ